MLSLDCWTVIKGRGIAFESSAAPYRHFGEEKLDPSTAKGNPSRQPSLRMWVLASATVPAGVSELRKAVEGCYVGHRRQCRAQAQHEAVGIGSQGPTGREAGPGHTTSRSRRLGAGDRAVARSRPKRPRGAGTGRNCAGVKQLIQEDAETFPFLP